MYNRLISDLDISGVAPRMAYKSLGGERRDLEADRLVLLVDWLDSALGEDVNGSRIVRCLGCWVLLDHDLMGSDGEKDLGGGENETEMDVACRKRSKVKAVCCRCLAVDFIMVAFYISNVDCYWLLS